MNKNQHNVELRNDSNNTSDPDKVRLLIAWSHIPVYAAHALRCVSADVAIDLTVLATEPPAGRREIEKILSKEVVWLDEKASATSLQQLGIQDPDIVMTSGYHTKVFNSIAADARERGSFSVLMCDHNWLGTPKQMVLDRFRYWLVFKRRYDAILVPGRSGETYAKNMGFSPDRIFQKLYGANHSLFANFKPITQRKKRFLFVGQLIGRKNVLNVCKAFLNVSEELENWSLTICGRGPLKTKLPKHERIEIFDFLSAEEVSSVMSDSRVLLLPSKVDHWGVVLHEATLAGCMLITTSGVGAHEDLCSDDNSIIVDTSVNSISIAMRDIADRSESQLELASKTSIELSRMFGPKMFKDAVNKIIDFYTLTQKNTQITRIKNN